MDIWHCSLISIKYPCMVNCFPCYLWKFQLPCVNWKMSNHGLWFISQTGFNKFPTTVWLLSSPHCNNLGNTKSKLGFMSFTNKGVTTIPLNFGFEEDHKPSQLKVPFPNLVNIKYPYMKLQLSQLTWVFNNSTRV